MPPFEFQFDLITPARVIFGWGRRRELPALAAGLGHRAFVVCGSQSLIQSGVLDEVATFLADGGVSSKLVSTITREPQVEDVDELTKKIRKQSPAANDFLLAIGGGSAIDLAKASAAMVTNAEGSSVRDFLEGVGRGLKVTNRPLSLLAMPTTSGTGSEATKNAVISSSDPPFKKSLRSEMMVPNLVLVDPELTVTNPPELTAYCGMDAITQLIESYISCRAQLIPQALVLGTLRDAIRGLGDAFENGEDRWAREAIAHGALVSGMALANSGLGMAHGVAAALGICAGVPHGLACAMMLPATLKANRQTATEPMSRLEYAIGTERYDTAEQAAGGLIKRIETLCEKLRIPSRLSEVGVQSHQIPHIAQLSRGNSMNGNPREISDDELTLILKGIL